MPRYRVTFSDVSIKEMYVESESEDKIFEDYVTLDNGMQDAIDNAVEVDGYYDREIIIEPCE